MTTATQISPAEFRAKVTEHLAAALKLVPATVPNDVFDACVRPMMDELQQLDEFLFDIGAEERRREDQERAREAKLAGKRAQPDVEHRVVQLDYQTQRLLEFIGDPTKAKVVTAMFVDAFLHAVVRFLDAVPDGALAEDRFVPEGFNESTKPTVTLIVSALRARRGAA